MIRRTSALAKLSEAMSFWRGVVLVGPRQVGKTTLARQFLSPSSPNYFDLENIHEKKSGSAKASIKLSPYAHNIFVTAIFVADECKESFL